MERKSLTVLVTGATGHQGGALARVLLNKGHKVRAFTRKPDGPEAKALKKLGAEVWKGRFEDRTSPDMACRGVDAVFAMSTPMEAGPEVETRQGIAVADACKAMGVPFLLFTSVEYSDRSTGIPFFDSKYRVEQHIRRLGVPYTIIAPAYFMENVLGPWMLPGLQQGKLSFALPPIRRLEQIALQDIANFAALILEDPERFSGRRIDISSDNPTMEESAKILSRAIGQTIVYEEIPLSTIRSMNEDYAKMLEWLGRMTYSNDIAALREDYPEVGWHTYEEWAKAQDWRRILKAGKKAA